MHTEFVSAGMKITRERLYVMFDGAFREIKVPDIETFAREKKAILEYERK